MLGGTILTVCWCLRDVGRGPFPCPFMHWEIEHLRVRQTAVPRPVVASLYKIISEQIETIVLLLDCSKLRILRYDNFVWRGWVCATQS